MTEHPDQHPDSRVVSSGRDESRALSPALWPATAWESSDLDDATCKLVTRRARFKPATDGEGNPTTGSYSNAVRWQIPR